MIGLTAILAHPLPLALFTALLGWWLFLLAALDVEELRELLLDAWRMCVPKTVAAAYEG